MRIISTTPPLPASTHACGEALQALKCEVERLKKELAALRGSAQPVVAPSPVTPEPVAGPVVLPASADPVFSQLWNYVNKEK